MIEEVVSVELPVHERLVVRKNRLMNEENGIDMPRISIVTGTHGDELDGQYICYEVIRRIEREKNKLKGIVDIIQILILLDLIQVQEEFLCLTLI